MRERSLATPKSLAGLLLLAHPALQDPNFRRSVVLMSAHDPDGAMGVVLNRPLGQRLGEANGDFALGPLAGVPLYCGGPVQPEQLLLAAWQSRPDGFRLFFGIEPDRAAQLLGEGDAIVRGFLGYSGWSAGQLDHEMSRQTWIVAEVPGDLLTQQPDDLLWRTVLAAAGDEWRLLADEPEHPENN